MANATPLVTSIDLPKVRTESSEEYCKIAELKALAGPAGEVDRDPGFTTAPPVSEVLCHTMGYLPPTDGGGVNLLRRPPNNQLK